MLGGADDRSFAARYAPPLFLLVVSALVRFPFFDEPPGRDQGLFIAQAWQWIQGASLYDEIWEHKPGGVITLYGLALEFGGIRPVAIQFLHLLAGAATAITLFVVASRAGLHAVAATLAGFFYLVFFGGPLFGGFWATAQVEVFIDLLVALSLLLLIGGNRVPPRSRCFLAGLLIGLAVFGFKYSGLPLLALVLLLWFPRAKPWAPPGSSLVLVVAGFLLPAVGIVSYFAATDRFADFWRATVEFNWAHRQIDAPAENLSLLSRLLPFLDALWVLYGLTAWAFIARVLFERQGWYRDRLLAAAGILFVAALAQVFFQGKFWVYHYHVILLPLALGGALGLQSLAELSRPRERVDRNLWIVALLATFFLLVSYGPFVAQYTQQHRLLEYWQNRISESDWHATYLWGGADYDYAETLAAAGQIERSSLPGERVFVWGFEPSLYWLAQRKPSSRFLYDYPLSSHFGELASQYRSELLGDLEAHPPAIVIVVSRDASDIESESSDHQLRSHPELAAYLTRDYEPRWRLGDFTGYERREGSAGPSP